jgi:hypothetical protein
MPNPPPKHGNPAKANQSRSLVVSSPTDTSSKQTEPETPPFSQRLKQWWRRFRPIGKYIALFSSFISGVILIIPKFSISPSVNVDPSDALATFFFVKNEGHVPAFDVNVYCFINHPLLQGARIVAHAPNWVVWPGQTMTRGCGVKAGKIDASMNVAVEYKWPLPWVGWTSTQTVHFTGRHGAAGYFLVPDLD